MRVWWLLAFATAGCSPYNFSKEVSAISAGVDQVSTGFTTGFDSLAADRASAMRLQLTATRGKIAIATACFLPPPKPPAEQLPCTVYEQGEEQPMPTAIEQKRVRTMAVVTVLTDYAHALAAVTNAADRTAFNAAVSQLSSAVGALAKEAGPAAPGLSTVAPAGVNFVGWLVGTALDAQRFESLKAGVTAASSSVDSQGDSAFSVVVTVLGDGLTALNAQRKAVLTQEIGILRGQLQPSLSDAAYRQGLTDLESLLVVLDGLRQTDPAAAVTSLIKAHQALLAAVDDPSRNYPSLVKAVSDFASQAANLQTALGAKTTPASAAKAAPAKQAGTKGA